MSAENTCNCKHAVLDNALVAELGNKSDSRLDFGTTYHSLREHPFVNFRRRSGSLGGL